MQLCFGESTDLKTREYHAEILQKFIELVAFKYVV